MTFKTIMFSFVVFFALNCFASFETTKYFIGEEVVKTPQGHKISSTFRVIKRVEDGNSITETITYKKDEEVLDIVFLKRFEEQKMEISGPLSGQGVIMGSAHNRTGWNAELSYPEGSIKQGRIQLTDTVIGNNVFSVTNYLDAEGVLVGVSKVLYVQIEVETYKTLIQALKSSIK